MNASLPHTDSPGSRIQPRRRYCEYLFRQYEGSLHYWCRAASWPVFPTPFDTWWANLAADAVVIALALALDRALPEPPDILHPVVWIGRTLTALERFAPRPPSTAFAYGAVAAMLTVAACSALVWLAMAGLATLGAAAYMLGGAVLLRTSFAVRGLVTAAADTQRALECERLDEARQCLLSLVARDRASLTPALISAAAIESVAENTTDSFVSPWMAFAILGVPGALAFRAVNTLDSMWGKRGRYEYLGKFAARLDDVVNYVPARVSALLLLFAGALAGSPSDRGWSVMLRDQHLTESPNAGWTMAAMAGLLGRRLAKLGHYVLGANFPEPKAADIGLCNRIATRTALLGVVVTLCLLSLRHWSLA